MTRYPAVWYCGQCGRVIPGTEVPDPDACCPRRRAAWADDAPTEYRRRGAYLRDLFLAACILVAVAADAAWKRLARWRAVARSWWRYEPPCY